MKKNRNSYSYLDEFKTYLRKQYDPGFYTGGNIDIKFRAKTKAGAYWILMTAVLG